jgi:4-alpha-glucanotransferase
LGEGARQFIDFLHKSNQSIWQILPLAPTSFGDSPYQSFSSFAGNYLLISPELLFSENLEGPEFDPRAVDYGRVIKVKNEMFRRAFERFDLKDGAYLKFCRENESIGDYALFIALKNHFINERSDKILPPELIELQKAGLSENMAAAYYYGAVWSTWPKELVYREPAALKAYSQLLANEIEYQKFLQFKFFEQWSAVKTYANERDIKIVGDTPIFAAYDSCDVWVDKKIFALDEKGFPKTVAGVPPDYFSATGQLWGNPLYDWDYNRRTYFKWWVKRIEASLKFCDILRIDHFRAFDTYWEIKFGAEDAVKGIWKKGPGKALFDAVETKIGKIPIIAEDLGEISPGTEILRRELDFPGMKILQFAFESDEGNVYLPNNYEDNNMAVYTGTHDNDTTVGWYQKTSEKTRDFLRRYLNVSGADAAWDLIRLAFRSQAKFAIVPIQDVMSLGSKDRMNAPGTASGNWAFRYSADMLKDDYAEGLKYLSKLYNRNLRSPAD